MTLIKQVETRIIETLRLGKEKEVEKNILRVLLGDAQTLQARQGTVSEDQFLNLIRKLLKGINETLAITADNQKLLEEKRILEELLPKTLSKEEVLVVLQPIIEQIKTAKADGQATGLAVKYLKENKHNVNGNDVSELVKGLRCLQ